MSLVRGQLLKDYRVLGLLGQGGFAEVYRAEHHALHSQVALKVLTVAGSAVEMRKHHEQFLLEARTLAALRHPNVARVHDYFVAPEGHVIVMELIEGRALERVLGDEGSPGLSWEKVTSWTDQILDALEYMHGQSPPVIIRDLTPGNVMLEEGGRIVLIDFGLVKQLQLGVNTKTVVRGSGTPGYAPIEQYGAAAASTDQRSDLYSLGAVLHCLLTGSTPPEAVALYRKVESLENISGVNPTVTPSLDQAIKRFMAPEPADRPQSVAEARNLLAGVLTMPSTLTLAAPPQVARAPALTKVLTWTALTRRLLPPPSPARSRYSPAQVLGFSAALAIVLAASDLAMGWYLSLGDTWDARTWLSAFMVTLTSLALLYRHQADDASLQVLFRKAAMAALLLFALDLVFLIQWWSSR